jgi:hypothetical protein
MEWFGIVLSLLSGLLGFVVGAVITLKADQQKQRRLNEGAARITFFELSANTAFLQGAINFGRTTPLVISTWPTTRAQIASMLGPRDLAVVATAYMKIELTKTAWELQPLPSPMVAVAATRAALDRANEAANILERVGWPLDTDRTALGEALSEHIKPSP